MANFTPNKHLDILNYNYSKFINEKVEIDNYNASAKKANERAALNKRIYTILAITIISLFTIAMSVITWAIIHFGQVFNSSPLKIPMMIVLILAFITAGVLSTLLVCKHACIKYESSLIKELEYTEKIRFALIAEKGTLSNVRIMEPENKRPYNQYDSILSFDAVSEKGIVTGSYKSAENAWKITFVPTVFGTTIDVESLTIIAPYEPEAASAEAAFKAEKKRREAVEMEYEEYKKNAQNDRNKSDEDRAKLVAENTRCNQEILDLRKSLEEREEELKNTLAALDEAEAIHNSNLKEIKDAHEFDAYTLSQHHAAQIDDYEGKITELNALIESLRNELSIAEANLVAADHENKTSNTYYQARKEEYDKMKVEFDELKRKANAADELSGQVKSLSKLLQEQKDELALSREKIQLLEIQKNTLDEEYRKAREELNRLQRASKDSNNDAERRYNLQIKENYRLTQENAALKAELAELKKASK